VCLYVTLIVNRNSQHYNDILEVVADMRQHSAAVDILKCFFIRRCISPTMMCQSPRHLNTLVSIDIVL